MKRNVANVEKIIKEKRGNLSAVARHFGVTRQTIYTQVSKSTTLQAALEEARETMLDNAETVLYDEVLDGNTPLLIFFLKTQGKSRGYIERQEVTGADGNTIKVSLVNDD